MNKQQVIEKIGKKNWKKFQTFMVGQTARMKDGEFDYYGCDVENFINKINGRPTFFD